MTDKGNLSVNCGRILVKTIHDYDEGVTLGIGASFQVNQTDQGKKDVSFSHAPVKVEFKDHRREVAGTIGQGKITSGEIKGDQLNRDISQQAQVTKEQQASFDSVVHADMLKTLLGSKEESKRPPNIKTLTRTVCGQTLPEMIRDYFFDIADTAKQAAKDVITSGAKAANIFGAKVNPDQLADNLDKGFDWHLGLKLSSEEVRKFNEKYADTKKKLEEKAADGDKEEKHHLIFQQNLQQQVAQADSDGSSNKAALQTLLHIYQVLYHKEQSAAEKEGRPVKSFEEFAAYVNKNYIYKSPVFAAKVHNNLVSALLETQLMLDARLQSSVEKVDGRNHADQHSNYPEDKTAHHPKFISGGENSIKSSKVGSKGVLGAGQNKDGPRATTTVDDKPFDYSMLFLAKPESKELKLSPDTAALLKAILPFQQVPSSSTTTGGSEERSVEEIAPHIDINDITLLIAKNWLTKLANDSTGWEKNWALNTIKAIEQVQITRTEESPSLQSYGDEVERNRLTGKTGYLGDKFDAVGNLMKWGIDSFDNRMAKGFPLGASLFKGGVNLTGQYIKEAAIEIFGEEKVKTAEDWVHDQLKDLTSGQQTFVGVFGPMATMKGLGIAVKGVGKIGGLVETSTNKLGKLEHSSIPLEVKPVTSSLASAVEHKLPMALSEELLQPTWSNWTSAEKVIIGTKEYGKCGDLLYTRHALENTYPSSLGRVAGHTSNHPPVGIPPAFVQMIIDSPHTKIYEKVVDGIGRKIYETESVRVITENNIVITIIRKK